VICFGGRLGRQTPLGFANTIPVTRMMGTTPQPSHAPRPEALVVEDVPFVEAHFEFKQVLAPASGSCRCRGLRR